VNGSSLRLILSAAKNLLLGMIGHLPRLILSAAKNLLSGMIGRLQEADSSLRVGMRQ
jgi:hypothetical protein